MSDISDIKLIIMLICFVGIWFSGFHHGKWYGIQKAEARQRLIDRTQRDLDAAQEGYKRR
jgi:cbb3-type cytochrome oxidase subunit 3